MYNDLKLLELKKIFFIYLYKIYIKKKKEHNLDKFNYLIIQELSKMIKYINNFLKINYIHKDYFYGAKYFNINDCNDINILINKMNIFDENKFIDIIDYKLNLQEKINIDPNIDPNMNSNIDSNIDSIDKSPYMLFTYVNEKKFKLLPYKYFLKISQLFSKTLGIKEENTKYKDQIIKKFINIICNTKVFIFLFHILREKKIIKHFCDFPTYIHKLWFSSYSKKNMNDSSLFEHIFIGETTYKYIYGFHNWIQFYNEEKIGKINYYGYIKYISNIIFIKFSWENKTKKLGSFFIGTSIEFEMALYTLLHIYTDDNKYKIKVKYQSNDIMFRIIKENNKLITIYPKL